MVEIQTAKRIAPIDYTGVPEKFVGKLSAVCRTALECEELVHWFGDADFCPFLPIMVFVPGAPAPTLIPGFGYAPAAELRDCAVYAWHKQGERIRKTGSLVDFDALREKHGMMRREDVDPATREALRRRAAQHKANPISDPERVPVRRNPTNRKVFERK